MKKWYQCSQVIKVKALLSVWTKAVYFVSQLIQTDIRSTSQDTSKMPDGEKAKVVVCMPCSVYVGL